MAGVNASLSLNLTATLSGAALAGGAARYRAAVDKLLQLEPGNGELGLGDLLYTAERAVAAGANDDLDLAGALLSPVGSAFVAAEVVVLYVEADADNAGDLVVGAAAANPFVGPLGAAGTYTLRPGEWVPFVSAAGWVVTAATGDILRIANPGGAPANYTIIALGRSVAD